MKLLSKHTLPRPQALTIFCLAIAASIFSGCGKKEAPLPPSTPEVAVMTIQPKAVPIDNVYVAQTQSSRLVNIYSRVSGFLDRRVYTEGEVVKAGQVLFLIDPKPFQVQLAQAEAALARQEAALEVARSVLTRTKPLALKDAVSKKDLDDAQGRFETASADVEQAKAEVESAKLNLSYCTITSPCDGITSAALQQDGTYISAQNSQLTTVMVLSPIWINFSISENELQAYRNQINKGLLLPPEKEEYIVEVILVDGTVYPSTGRLTFAEPMYNSETGTFLIRASVDNPDGILRPNQYVRVRLKGARRPHAILIPQRAVQTGARGQFVWVLNQNGTVDPRPVTVGNWYGDEWFIDDGLQAGEQIVVDGGMTLHPGSKVSISSNSAETDSKSADAQ
nr:efflux RND transporter periplasmic adaptor subunit [Deltaproteobacteria bacterium]